MLYKYSSGGGWRASLCFMIFYYHSVDYTTVQYRMVHDVPTLLTTCLYATSMWIATNHKEFENMIVFYKKTYKQKYKHDIIIV